MKTFMGILLAVVVCIYFLTKPTVEKVATNTSGKLIIDTSSVILKDARKAEKK
jgi:hypothetical protein